MKSIKEILMWFYFLHKDSFIHMYCVYWLIIITNYVSGLLTQKLAMQSRWQMLVKLLPVMINMITDTSTSNEACGEFDEGVNEISNLVWKSGQFQK